MFGSKRKKATSAAIDALRPIIATAQLGGGLATHMYFDPYVLGYLSSTASLFARAETKDKASPTDIGVALQTAFETVCNVNGEEAAKAAIQFTDDKDESFFQGTNDATVSFLYTLGMVDETHDSDLMRDATEFADSSGDAFIGASRETAIGGALMMLSFQERVKELRGDRDHA